MAKTKKNNSWVFYTTGAILLVTLILGGVFLLYLKEKINKGYYGVFLNNEQVYFARLEKLKSDWVTISDIYYFQTKNDAEDLKLIKLGSEIHGPQDKMLIPTNSIRFLSPLRPDSKILQSIINTSKTLNL